MDFKKLVFDKKFRDFFPELKVKFDYLDKLGGSNCKSCNLSKQRRVIRDIQVLLNSDKTLTKKWVEFNSNHTGSVTSGDEIMCFLYFKRAFLYSGFRDFLGKNYGKIFGELKIQISRKGFFSTSNEPLYYKIYELYKSDKNFRDDVEKFLRDNKLKNKLSINSPMHKVLVAESEMDLENKVNEFCADKKLISLSLDGLKAIITFELIAV